MCYSHRQWQIHGYNFKERQNFSNGNEINFYLNRNGNCFLFLCSKCKKKFSLNYDIYYWILCKDRIMCRWFFCITMVRTLRKFHRTVIDEVLIIELSKRTTLKRWRKYCVENTAWNKNESRNILQEFSLTSVEWVSKPDGMTISSYQTVLA